MYQNTKVRDITAAINNRIKNMEKNIIGGIGLDEFHLIQAGLRKNDDGHFNSIIVAKTKADLSNWVEKEYPSLSEEIQDIQFNVYRRIKYWIRYKEDNLDHNGWVNLVHKFLKQECQLAIPSEENKLKNLGLTRSEFRSLVAKLQKGDERLIETVYLANFKKSLSNLIRAYSCSYDEAYESTMDALIELRKDLIKGRIQYGNLGSYFNRRAALVLFKKRKKSKLDLISLSDEFDFHAEPITDSSMESAQIKEMISDAINKLGEECRSIIKQYYFDEVKLEKIALQFDKTHAAIRKQISRCRNKLRNYISKDFYLTFEINNG